MAKSLIQKRYTVTLDDDPMVSRIVEEATGIKTLPFDSAKSLVEDSWRHHPLAAFIDINLGIQERGLDIIPNLRQEWTYCPIIVITSDSSAEVVGEALTSGADDFLQKPLRPAEVVARMNARITDLEQKRSQSLVPIADVSLDSVHRMIEGPLGKRYLSPTETTILLGLSRAKGAIVAKTQLKHWGWPGLQVSDNALDRKVFDLRKSISDVSETLCIESVYGKGLRLGRKE